LRQSESLPRQRNLIRFAITVPVDFLSDDSRDLLRNFIAWIPERADASPAKDNVLQCQGRFIPEICGVLA